MLMNLAWLGQRPWGAYHILRWAFHLRLSQFTVQFPAIPSGQVIELREMLTMPVEVKIVIFLCSLRMPLDNLRH
jgi:hypothetical protein